MMALQVNPLCVCFPKCEELLDTIDPDAPRSSDQFIRKPLISYFEVE